eukprot:sb/3477329/
MCLDEATSNIDHDTDSVIQEVLREELGESTLITIAHRIDTVMEYDKVIVMSHGEMVEIGCPRELARDGDSQFYRLYALSRAGQSTELRSKIQEPPETSKQPIITRYLVT